MDELLRAVAPELAALLRAVADHLDGVEDLGPDPEADPVITMPTPVGFIDERGAWVTVPPSHAEG